MRTAVDFSHDRPVLIDKFLEQAAEFDVDASPMTPPALLPEFRSTSRKPESIQAILRACSRRCASPKSTWRRCATTPASGDRSDRERFDEYSIRH